MKHAYLLIFLFASTFSFTHAQEVLSPNKQIKVELSVKNASDKTSYSHVFFRVLYKMDSEFVEVLPNSPLGILRDDQTFSNNLRFVGASEAREVHDKYEMICGKRKIRENFAEEKVFRFENSNNQPLHIVLRAYNDGVAFRYEFPNPSDSFYAIIDEATTYILPDSTSRWMMPYDKSYEDFFPFSKTGVGEKEEQEWAFPALYKVNNHPVWVLISETNVSRENCGTRLSNLANPNEYKVTYPLPREDFPQTGVKTKLPWKSQWHMLIIGALSDVVESTLMTDVSDPEVIETSDWIEPGAVSWIYWAHNRGSKDYQIVVEYIDLAVEMGWPYVLIDWEWDVMSNGGDIMDAVNYAKINGVKPLVWYNSGTDVDWHHATPNDRLLTSEKRAKEFSWLNEIGVYGIKVDFFAGDQQDIMQFYIDLLEDAAKYNLLMNFHGATTPRGWSRAYPNLMTTEAVYGAEWYNNKHILTDKAAAHNSTIPFTRNVIGSMDYTPVTFSHSQHPHITSYGHELALSVVFESCLQHFADRPEAYNSLPEEPKDFLRNVPVSWDDTKLVDGYPGDRVIIARKKGNQWYLGGLNGKDEPRSLSISFDFLEEGTYTLKIIKDGEDDTSFSTEKLEVKKGDRHTVACLPRGGFVGILEATTDLK